MDDPRGRQHRFNLESRDQGDAFAHHRARVASALAARDPSASGRLCILGAGNGNDLDLPGLLGAYREIHLVDLDGDALARAVERQGVADRPSIRLHPKVDLTGMIDAMTAWSPLGPIRDPDLVALVDWPSSRVRLALPGPFDVVASTCLLSQIVGNVHESVGDRHPRFSEAVRAIRLGHLRLLSSLTTAGGAFVLVADLISSDRAPGLKTTPESSLPGLVDRLARDGGLIHGMNPAEILGSLRRDPQLASSVAGLEVLPPWPWTIHRRVYLVWAVRCRVGGVGKLRLPDPAPNP